MLQVSDFFIVYLVKTDIFNQINFVSCSYNYLFSLYRSNYNYLYRICKYT